MLGRFPLLVTVGLGLFAGPAKADDVPLPVKKPRDAHGIVSADAPAQDAQMSKPSTNASASKEPQPFVVPVQPSKGNADGKATTATPEGTKDPKSTPADDPEPKTLTEWPADEIALAKARCTVVMKGIPAVAVPEPPMRVNECGAPAPVRLISVGRDPEVTLDPPAVLKCDMVAALHKWLSQDLQPLARKQLAAEIIKISNMSDYSCRNAYGRTSTKLSEHGRANALDIRGFVTAKGEQAYVLEGWGPTQRDIAAARAAAEKAAAEKLAAEKIAADEAAAEAAAATRNSTAAKPSGGTTTEPRQLPEGLLPSNIEGVSESGLGLAPNQLGGPKEKKDQPNAAKPGKTKATSEAPIIKTKPEATNAALGTEGELKRPPARISRFLHEAHAAACRIFGTTLGPEANNAHLNHFHVDMAPRKHKNICD